MHVLSRSVLLPSLLVVGCATGAAENPVPHANESAGNVRSAVSVSPVAADGALVLDAPTAGAYVPTEAFTADNSGNSPYVVAGFGGSQYFLAWNDGRVGIPAVYGMRLDETGVPLDPTGVLLSTLTHPVPPGGDLLGSNQPREGVQVAAGAKGAITAWYARGAFDGGGGVEGARVSLNGSLLPFSVPGALDGIPGSSIRPTHWSTADQDGFSLFYYKRSLKGGIDLVLRRLGAEATELGAPRIVLENMQNALTVSSPLFASSNGTSAIFAWKGGDGMGSADAIRYVVVPFNSADTVTVRELSVVGSPILQAVSSASGGHRLVLSDADTVKTVRFDDVGTTVSAGAPLTISGNAQVLSVRPDGVTSQFIAEVVKNGDYSSPCLLAFTESATLDPCLAIAPDLTRPGGGIFGDRGWVAGSTTLLDLFPPASSSQGNLAALARYSKTSVALLDRLTVSRASNTEDSPKIATDGSEYVVVWRDTRASTTSETRAMFARRLDATGAPKGDAVQLSTGRLAKDAAPQLVFDGTKYFVAWTEQPNENDPSGHNMVGAVLPRSGTLTVEKTITIAENQRQESSGSLAVGSDGVNRIVVWPSQSSTAYVVVGVRISIADGSIVDTTPKPISQGGRTFRISPALAFDGTRTFVTWLEQNGFSFAIYGAYLEPGAIEPKAKPEAIFDRGAIGAFSQVAGVPGKGFFFAWHEFASQELDLNVYGKFIRSDGTTVGINGAGESILNEKSARIPLRVGTFDARSPAVANAGDGESFLVAWGDTREGAGAQILGGWVSAQDGRVRDPDGVPFAARPKVTSSNPSLATHNDGTGLLVYQEYDADPNVNAFRVRIRRIESGILRGKACTTNESCASRECVDGVCCESACDGECGVCNAVPGTCTPKASGIQCGRLSEYKCDGASIACPVSCKSADDCASRSCVNGLCEAPGARCVDDFKVRDSSGAIVDCGVYRCKANACRNPCSDVSDCADGLVCSFDGVCLTPEPPTNSEGCSAGRGGLGDAVAWSMLAAFGAVVARRRSRREGDAK